MLFSRPTKYGAGLYVYGDYNDLRSLYETIHELFPEELSNSKFYDFIMELAYEVRHAYQGQREIYTEYKEINTLGTGNYFGFRMVWPYFLIQLRLLRDSAAYRPTSIRQQANLYLLEDCAYHALITYEPAIGNECFDCLVKLSRFPSNYLLEYVHDCTRSYLCEGKAGKTRFKKLPDILRSLNSYSKGYGEFRNCLEQIAKEKNCEIDVLYNPTPFCDFKW